MYLRDLANGYLGYVDDRCWMGVGCEHHSTDLATSFERLVDHYRSIYKILIGSLDNFDDHQLAKQWWETPKGISFS